LQAVTVTLRHSRVHAADCESCETRDGHIDRIERDVQLTGDLEPDQRARLLEIANKCPVHRTLTSEIDIRTRLLSAPRRKAHEQPGPGPGRRALRERAGRAADPRGAAGALDRPGRPADPPAAAAQRAAAGRALVLPGLLRPAHLRVGEAHGRRAASP